MQRISLMGGSLTNNKQNMKQSAYFEYLRSFSQNGLETLEKLQKQFNKHFNRQKLSEEHKVLKKVKTLISSYQVFVIQMNDSCEFVEVPDLGKCVLKLFIQLMGILKWSLQFIEFNTKNEQVNGVVQSQLRRESHMMRNTFNGKFGNKNNTTIRCSQCTGTIVQNSSPKDIFRLKQQTSMQLKDINEQLTRINKEYAQAEETVIKQQNQHLKLQEFIHKRQEKGIFGDASKNEEILSEILYTLNRKGQAIGRFADLRINSLAQFSKASNNEENYDLFRKELEKQITGRLQQAKQKLAMLFREHVSSYQKQKQQSYISVEVQTEVNQKQKALKMHDVRFIKRLKNQIAKLQSQLECEKHINEGMKNLLKQKSDQFQGQRLKYRNQIINYQIKTRKQLKLKKQTLEDIPSQQSLQDKSLVSINLNEDNSFKALVGKSEKIRQSLIFQSDDIVQNYYTRTVHQTGKRLSRNRRNILKIFSEKHEKLKLDLATVSLTCQPSQKIQNQTNQQPKFTLVSNQTSTFQGNISKKHIAIQTQQAKKKIIDKKIFQRLSKSKEMKTIINKPNKQAEKKRTSLLTYVKRTSSHMGQLAEHFYIRYGEQLVKQNQPFGLKSKKSHQKSHFQRDIAMKTFTSGDKTTKNTFLPLFQLNDFSNPMIKNSKKSLEITEQWLSKVFMSVQNAKNYEVLTLQRQKIKNIYGSTDSKTNLNHHKSISFGDANWSYRKDGNSMNILDKIVNEMMHHMKILRNKNYKNYQSLRNFLRYPSFVCSAQQANFAINKEPIQLTQMKTMIGRILKLHENCYPQSFQQNLDNNLCNHLKQFFQLINLKL